MIHMSTNIKCYYDKINELNGKMKNEKNKKKKISTNLLLWCGGGWDVRHVDPSSVAC